MLALLTYLTPACLALGLMMIGHVHLSMPVNFLTGLIATILATLLEFTPSAVAITAHARGHWLLGDVAGEVFGPAAVTLGVSITLLAPAAMLGASGMRGGAPGPTRS